MEPDREPRSSLGRMLGGIVGRERELASIARFVEELTDQPRVLLLEGEAGIGKTVLWRAAWKPPGAGHRVLVAGPPRTRPARPIPRSETSSATCSTRPSRRLRAPARALEIALLRGSRPTPAGPAGDRARGARGVPDAERLVAGRDRDGRHPVGGRLVGSCPLVRDPPIEGFRLRPRDSAPRHGSRRRSNWCARSSIARGFASIGPLAVERSPASCGTGRADRWRRRSSCACTRRARESVLLARDHATRSVTPSRRRGGRFRSRVMR